MNEDQVKSMFPWYDGVAAACARAEASRDPVRIETGPAAPPGYPIEATCSQGCPNLESHPLSQYPRYADRGHCAHLRCEVDPDYGCSEHPYWVTGAPKAETQETVRDWARSINPAELPGRTIFLRFLKEVRELRSAMLSEEPDDFVWLSGIASEIADVQIMLWHIANHCTVDAQGAVNSKMAINRTREWEIQPDGTFSHKESNPSPGETGESEVSE